MGTIKITGAILSMLGSTAMYIIAILYMHSAVVLQTCAIQSTMSRDNRT